MIAVLATYGTWTILSAWLELHPRVKVLGRFCSRLLPEQRGAVVLQCSNAHSDGSGYLGPANACPQFLAAPKKAENRPHGSFCSWWIVSIYIHWYHWESSGI